LRTRFSRDFELKKPVSVEFKVADFDGGKYHIWTHPENKSELNISFTSGAAEGLLTHGGKEELQKTYGSAFVAAESGYAVTLKYQVDGVPAGEQGKMLVV